MFVSIFGYIFFFVGFLILALPVILVELSKPKDWLMGGLFLFLGLFLQVENEILRGSINLLVISMAILYGKMILEIFQTRWYQLGTEEKKNIGSFHRWLESLKQLGQIFASIVSSCSNFFVKLISIFEKPVNEKKWVHPKLKQEVKKKLVDTPDSTDSNKIINKELS